MIHLLVMILFAALVSLVLIILYLSFLPLLHTVTKRIRRRLHDMKHRVEEMEHQAFLGTTFDIGVQTSLIVVPEPSMRRTYNPRSL